MSFLTLTLLTLLVLYIIQRWIAFILLFNPAFKVSSIKYLARPLSTFHQINAYEEDGFLILDMCASDDGQAIFNYNVQNLRKSGEALDEVSRLNKGQQVPWFHHFPQSKCNLSGVLESLLVQLNSLFVEAEKMLISHQVYNTLCRIFPRRFVLPLSVDHDTPYDQNLNNRPNSTATSVRIAKNKVGSRYNLHLLYQHSKL